MTAKEKERRTREENAVNASLAEAAGAKKFPGDHSVKNPASGKEVLNLIKRVCSLRAQAYSWAKVSRVLKYSVNYLRSIAWNHPNLWRREYDLAEIKEIEIAAAEALRLQRRLLKSPDEQLAQRAAHSILNHRARTWALRLDFVDKNGGAALFAQMPDHKLNAIIRAASVDARKLTTGKQRKKKKRGVRGEALD